MLSFPTLPILCLRIQDSSAAYLHTFPYTIRFPYLSLTQQLRKLHHTCPHSAPSLSPHSITLLPLPLPILIPPQTRPQPSILHTSPQTIRTHPISPQRFLIIFLWWTHGRLIGPDLLGDFESDGFLVVVVELGVFVGFPDPELVVRVARRRVSGGFVGVGWVGGWEGGMRSMDGRWGEGMGRVKGTLI